MQLNLEKRKLSIVFLITLLPVLFFPLAFSSYPLIYFAPFLIILYYQKSFLTCLWSSLLVGLLLDLLSANSHLGIFAMSYCLTSAFLYGQKRHYFADSVSTLPLMTYYFSLLSTFIQVILISTLEKALPLTWEWALTDLFYLPLLDCLYAFLVFTLPQLLFGQKQRQGRDYFIS